MYMRHSTTQFLVMFMCEKSMNAFYPATQGWGDMVGYTVCSLIQVPWIFVQTFLFLNSVPLSLHILWILQMRSTHYLYMLVLTYSAILVFKGTQKNIACQDTNHCQSILVFSTSRRMKLTY